MTEFAIEATGLTKLFGDFRAVDNLDLHVHKGTVVSLLGPNGAGKTTTVRMLATLLRPDSGRATVNGRQRGWGGAAHDVPDGPVRGARSEPHLP